MKVTVVNGWSNDDGLTVLLDELQDPRLRNGPRDDVGNNNNDEDNEDSIATAQLVKVVNEEIAPLLKLANPAMQRY